MNGTLVTYGEYVNLPPGTLLKAVRKSNGVVWYLVTVQVEYSTYTNQEVKYLSGLLTGETNYLEPSVFEYFDFFTLNKLERLLYG